MARATFLRVLGALVLTLVVCGATQAIMMEKTVTDLTQESEHIVIGRVTAVRSDWNADRSFVYTLSTVQVEREIKGSLVEKTIAVKTPGGFAPDMWVWVEDQPQLQPGQRVLLFLNRDEGGTYEVASWVQGKYTLRDGIVLERGVLEGEFLREIEGGPKAEPVQEGVGALACVVSPLPYDWTSGTPPAVMYANRNGTADVAGTAEFRSLQRSGLTWNNVANCYWTFASGGMTSRMPGSNDSYNTLGWKSGIGGAIAVTTLWSSPYTGRIIETDITFEDNYFWSALVDSTCPAYQMDVQNIATHEMGHVVLLNDMYNYDCRDATMYGYSNYSEVKKRSLSDPDIAAAQARYPGLR